MDDTFYVGHDELYHHAKFGKDRTTRAGCRCENVVFVFFLFLFFLSRSESRAPCVRGVHSSKTHCVAVYRSISTRFGSFFFGRDCSFRQATQFSHSSLVAPQFSRNCGQKLRKSKNSAEKLVRTTSYRQLRVLKKILPLLFMAWTVDVHLYKFFSACRYLALTASVKIRKNSPKTAPNEQDCAHQKPYRK